MNRFFLILISFSVILSTSCRKDFTCTCSKIYKNNTGDNVRDYSHQTYRDTRSASEEKCKAQVSSGSDETGNYKLNCQIEC